MKVNRTGIAALDDRDIAAGEIAAIAGNRSS